MRDIDIRQALLKQMVHDHSDESDTLIVEELGLCQGIARVDVAVVNGTLHGFEIKSARDTLSRLPAQSEVYNRSLEFVTIVVSAAHLKKVREVVPSWWGIWCATGDSHAVALKICRKGRRNPAVAPSAVAQLLWRDEALQILAERKLDKGLRGKSREQIWNHLAASLTPAELSHAVRSRLKIRGKSWREPALLTRCDGSRPPSST